MTKLNLHVDKNIELVLLEEAHAEAIFNLADADRVYLRQWLPWVDNTKSIEDTHSYIEQSKKAYSQNKGLNFSIFFQNQLVGQIGLTRLDLTNKKAMIGYWIGEAFQGKGITTKACKTLIDYCFSQLNLDSIEIHCGTDNDKSCAIPKRLGFKNEGTIKQGEFLNGKYIDLFLFSKLKSDWEAEARNGK